MADYIDPRIAAINDALLFLLGTEQLANKWWTSKNKAFKGQTPQTVFETDPSQVAQYIIRQLAPSVL